MHIGVINEYVFLIVLLFLHYNTITLYRYYRYKLIDVLYNFCFLPFWRQIILYNNVYNINKNKNKLYYYYCYYSSHLILCVLICDDLRSIWFDTRRSQEQSEFFGSK